MSPTLHALLLAVLILATSVWFGGYVAIVAVARTATATLTPADRITFFRRLGKTYLWIGTPALVVALAAAAVLARDLPRDGLLVSAAVVAALILSVLAVAIAQARRMTRLRRHAASPDASDALASQVRRGGHRAAALRAVLGLLTITLVLQGAFLVT